MEPDAFGFLTVVDSAAHGLFGGYLLVDAGGRPLEFHCTTPVTISRAQAILYGPTLDADVRGRQIGSALLAEASVSPRVVLVDDPATATVQAHTLLTVALVQARAASRAASVGVRGDLQPPEEALRRVPQQPPAMDAEGTAGAWRPMGDALVRPARAGATDVFDLPLPPFDLLEPFDRIRAAIDEVQRHG